MKGFLLLGLGAFAAGAAVGVVQQRRARLDEDYGEDPNWPAVPYTAATHPDSPQEEETVRIETPPAAPEPQSMAAEVEAAAEPDKGPDKQAETT